MRETTSTMRELGWDLIEPSGFVLSGWQVEFDEISMFLSSEDTPTRALFGLY